MTRARFGFLDVEGRPAQARPGATPTRPVKGHRMNMPTVPPGYVEVCTAALRELVSADLNLEDADTIVAALLPHVRTGERLALWLQIVAADDLRYRTCLDPVGDDANAEAVLVEVCRWAADRDSDLAREARYAAGAR